MPLWLASSVAAAAPPTLSAEAVSFVDRVRSDVDWLAGVESRAVGQPGHDRIVEELLAKVRAVPGAKVWTRQFPVLVPSVERAELRIESGPLAGVHRVYPLWPAGVKPHTTPAGGIEGRLIYVGRGESARVPPRSLDGQIAAVELAGGNWENAFNAGAAAVLLLGSPQVSEADARAHTTPIPIDAPRFYVPDGPLAEALRDGRAGAGRLLAQAGWREATATDIWVLVPPASPANPPRRALAVAAPLDAMSVVPQRAPGADPMSC